jgi:oligopeptide transport system substrate-binding protein
MWKKELGINSTLRSQEWKVYLNTLNMLGYDVARSSWVGDYNDPNTFLDCFVTGRGNNRTGWSNPRYDELMRQANAQFDPPRRAALLHEAETILVEDEVPIIPLYYFVGIALYDRTRLGGFAANIVDEHPLRELYWIPKP